MVMGGVDGGGEMVMEGGEVDEGRGKECMEGGVEYLHSGQVFPLVCREHH